jgi:hypothetical protein
MGALEMERAHKKLDVWKLSMRLAKEIYTVTSRFPREEQYSIVSQMRRAATSIPANIAEGAARRSKKEISSVPVHCQRIIKRIGYIY